MVLVMSLRMPVKLLSWCLGSNCYLNHYIYIIYKYVKVKKSFCQVTEFFIAIKEKFQNVEKFSIVYR